MRVSKSIQLGLLAVAVPLAAWGQAGQMSAVSPQGSGHPHSVPFTMTQTMTRVQTLANGTTITHTDAIRTMRDSQGRTRMERESSDWGTETISRNGDVSTMQPRGKIVRVAIMDPVENTNLNWADDGFQRLATLTHARRYSSPPPQTIPVAPRTIMPKDGPKAEMRREDFGIKSIKGVYARGSRTTTTYPAGFAGNSAAYVTVSEYWQSQDLNGMMVEEMRDGPEGKTVTTLDSFKEEEPDPALFKTPAGYTIWDQDGPPAANPSR